MKTYFYYPAFFDLFFLFEEFSEKLISGINGDVSLFMESFNQNVSRVVTGVLVFSLLIGFMQKWVSKVALFLGWLALIFVFFAEWGQHFYQVAYLLENLLKLAIIPIFLLDKLTAIKRYDILLKLSVLTFAGHGMYALDIFPRPGYFLDMVMKIFFLSEETAILFLNVIGALDLFLVFAVFIKPFQKWVLYYLIVWGFLTTIARPLLNFSWVFLSDSVIIWVPEFFIRVSHFLIPLGLYFTWKKLKIEELEIGQFKK